jgi:hypothetical protein
MLLLVVCSATYSATRTVRECPLGYRTLGRRMTNECEAMVEWGLVGEIGRENYSSTDSPNNESPIKSPIMKPGPPR